MAMYEFEYKDLGKALDSMTAAGLNALPYGTAKLDHSGEILFYSEVEQELSGYSAPNPIGLNWLKQVAPCTKSEAFNRFLSDAKTNNQLDILMEMPGDLNDPDAILEIRLISGASPGYLWMALRRRDENGALKA